jgi:hypothetical protein
MTLDSTHPARRFEGIFHLKNWASPARSVPSSHTDTLNLIKLLTGGKAKLTLTVGVEYGSGVRLHGELRSGGSTYTLYGSFIDPARSSDAAGTLVILNPHQQVRFRASLEDNDLTFTPATAGLGRQGDHRPQRRTSQDGTRYRGQGAAPCAGW